MSNDDIIYVSLLLFSIVFGSIYTRINDNALRKNVGSLVGTLLVAIVAGPQILHSIFTFFVNAFIITQSNPRICHKASFAFTFLYLCFFRTTAWFGIPYANGHTNLIQMMLTLKIVGLAFEVNSSYTNAKSKEIDKELILQKEFEYVKPDFIEIFHYCFNYIGVLTGPYYRYTTFRDSFERPFGIKCNNFKFLIEKIKYVPLYAGLFLLSSWMWPISYLSNDEFYQESWWYKSFYFWPCFLTFRMRIYIGLILSECVCIMGGLGAYPELTNPKAGCGPSQNFKQLKNSSQNCSYEAIHNINPYGAEFCHSYREGMKHWNMCIQYWLAVNIYKRFPSKKYRTIVTMLVSAFWHGVYTGYYICIATVPFVLPIENVWSKILLRKDYSELRIKIGKYILWFFRMNFLGYQGLAFSLLEANKILKYYNSVYHFNLILGLAFYVLGVRLLKKNKEEKNREQTTKN